MCWTEKCQLILHLNDLDWNLGEKCLDPDIY